MGKRRQNRAKRPEDPGFQAGPGALVAMSYELYDAEGELVESSEPGSTVMFLFGFGQVASGLERAAAGMRAGMARRVRLTPQEAFGYRDPKAILEVARSELPADAEVGDEFEAENEEGEQVALRVLELSDEMAILDANHPLAGQNVEVDIFVESVRPANPQELEAAERALLASGGSAAGTLIPPERLLKRDKPETAQDGPAAGPRRRLA